MVKVLENSVVDLDVMPGKKGEDMQKSVDGATYVICHFSIHLVFGPAFEPFTTLLKWSH